MNFSAEFKLQIEGKCVSSILTKERNEGFTEFQEAFDKYGDTMGQVFWPTHESYLKGLSERNPEETFTLDVFGDSTETIFKKYFKNGKMFVSQAVVTYETFDESKLK